MIFSPHLPVSRPHFLAHQISLPRLSSPPSLLPLRSPAIAASASTSTSASTAESASPPPPISLYNILGLQEKATIREIKAAYRSLARTCHPDVSSGASADEFMSVHAAYSTLSDPAKRAEYDRELIALRRSPPGRNRTPRRTWETDQCW